jgi:GntR family transcriptional regulator / MocR family aminotransferase
MVNHLRTRASLWSHSPREFWELERRLGKVLRFDRPAGGLALWTRIDDEINGFAWARRALEMGLKVKSGQDFARAGCTTPNAFRLGFGDLTESEIVQRIGLLARAMPRRKELGG